MPGWGVCMWQACMRQRADVCKHQIAYCLRLVAGGVSVVAAVASAAVVISVEAAELGTCSRYQGTPLFARTGTADAKPLFLSPRELQVAGLVVKAK